MTKPIKCKVVYNKDNITETLGEVLEKANKTQIRIAETEKYPHVTFFFSVDEKSLSLVKAAS
jgi:2,3-bisphosphoglycerate-independent phosphoglycerate mutase